MILRKIIALFTLVFLLHASGAYAEQYSHIEILPFTNSSGKEGLGIKVDLESGWKTYWRMPGEAGEAPKFDWQGSENIDKLEVKYPAPIRFTSQEIDGFGYERSVIFPALIEKKNQSEDAVLNLEADILVCNKLCVPEHHSISYNLSSGGVNNYKQVQSAILKLPTKLNESDVKNIWLTQEADGIYLNFNLDNIKNIDKSFDLFLENESMDILDRPQISFTSGASINVKAKVRYVYDLAKARKEIAGKAVTLTLSNGNRAYEVSTIMNDIAPNATGIDRTENWLNLKMIIIAFLGGLILNLMPCVLPVLSIKILSVLKYGGAEADEIEHKVLKSFMATSLGIVASFWIIGAGLSALKYMGQMVGWGIQFQHPVFLLFMILILIFFAANLWGIFELMLPQSVAVKLHKRGDDDFLSNFLSGMFATLLATPCSAPFLGTAIAFALSGSHFDIFSTFTFMGLGLASPYIALSFSPSLFKYLPKPGAWMEKLKKVLAVIVLLTAVWLISIFTSIYNQDVISSDWRKFDRLLIKPAIVHNKIVYVDITAKWCLTCKANKKFVLDTDEIKKVLNSSEILKLQGDWTAKNEYITKFLQENGRYGVPFNVIYSKKFPEGLVLPELLTKQIVLDSIDRAR